MSLTIVPPQSGAKRALLIGSPTGGLTGPAMDLTAMEAVLRLYDFSCTICYTEGYSSFPATRNGILAAWEQLLQQTSPGDAIVVYYSGHGGLLERDEDDTAKETRWRLQYIVPLDMEETTPGNFRGITDVEISDFLRSLTKRTNNITVILDCCHSASMARGPTRVKAMTPLEYPEVWRHIQTMFDQRTIGTDFPLGGNPDVVRVVGATASGSAFERLFPGGKQMGALTEALAEALTYALSTQASWRGILLHVRDRMSRTLPEQYPDVEGPIERFCFTTDGETLSGSLPVARTEKGFNLAGGRLHGVSEGDKYAIMPFSEGTAIPAKQIAAAQVTHVGVSSSSVQMEWKNQFHDIPTGAHGILVAKALNLLPVFVRGDDDFKRQTVSYIDSSEYLRSAEPTEEFSSLATVSKEGSRLKIKSSLGLLREWSVEMESELKMNIAKSVVVLQKLARAHHLLTLKNPKPWAHGLDVEYGWVDSGQRMPLTDPNHVLYAGQALYITLRNTSHFTLYVSIFDLVAENVVLISDLHPSGVEIPAGGQYEFGTVEFTGKLVGAEIEWPEDVPESKGIQVAEVLVITDNRMDLRSLETDVTVRKDDTAGAEGVGTELQDIVEQIGCASDRVKRQSQDSYKPLKFCTVPIFYKLAPRRDS